MATEKRSFLLLRKEVDESIHFFFRSKTREVKVVAHAVGQNFREALAENDLVRVFLKDLFLCVDIVAAVSQTYGYTIKLFIVCLGA
jgi:hypothetical protein